VSEAFTFHVPCARGTEVAVEHELADLGAVDVVTGKGVVSARGPLALMARANVFLRCGNRVLLELQRFDGVQGADDLVERLSRVPFEERLDAKGTFAVDAHLNQAEWTHSHYAAQRVKDVIVDRLRALGRGRPDVDTRRPSLRFVLHWERQTATLSLDTSGDPLHLRGYRRGVEGAAPMKETLAAAILAMGHADVERAFLDPCCGTGTLAIEQALRALRRAPGRDRRFGFERWSQRSPELDRALALARTEARDLEKRELPAPIRLSDWHKDAVDAAQTCIRQAGLEQHLVVERVDARRAELPSTDKGPGVVCSNLPFGERLGGNRLQLDGFYRTLGERFSSLPGLRVILFTAHPGARTLLNLDVHAHRSRHWKMKSGDLDAHLYRWDLKRELAPPA
jgi:putative N6-adenine-specific DNA methylase